jgi:Tol biopolymer transport system component
VNGRWTEPGVASFSGRYSEGGPRFSWDGKRLYYGSTRPLSGRGEPKDWDIWFVERTLSGWGEPQNLGAPVNTEKNENQPTLTRDGILYFLGNDKRYQYNNCIFRAGLKNGRYEKPESLPAPVNVEGCYAWCPFISPDGSYLLFVSNRKGGMGWGDIYISFLSQDKTWTGPVNLGPAVNSDDNDRFPALSPDGRILFFTSKRSGLPAYYEHRLSLRQLMKNYCNPGNGLEDIYWVDAKILKEMIRKELK